MAGPGPKVIGTYYSCMLNIVLQYASEVTHALICIYIWQNVLNYISIIYTLCINFKLYFYKFHVKFQCITFDLYIHDQDR